MCESCLISLILTLLVFVYLCLAYFAYICVPLLIPYWALLLGLTTGLTGPYWALQGFTRLYKALLGFTGPYWALLGFTSGIIACF